VSDEEPLPGGNVTQPSRIGDFVHRESGPWTPAIHALLRHLEAAGFAGAPRVIGFDDKGREVLTYIEGDSGTFPQALLHEEGLAVLGRFIRRFHDAAATFVPEPDALYRIGPATPAAGEIVCHGDLGFWNTVWRGDELVGLIDWDFAEPAPPLYDLALATMSVVPFRGGDFPERVGLALPVDRRARLEALCTGYGDVTPRELVETAATTIRSEIERLQSFGTAGREPWASGLTGGQLQLFEGIEAWIDEHGASLV
jgi:Ser/Thr protein kinase RdoA (MazF antagonist)